MALTRLSDLNMIDLPDCAGLAENGKCLWLDVPFCLSGACPFKKTEEAWSASLRKAFKRLSELDEHSQERIAAKYFNGKRL
jgi:hypothetical protein